MTTPSAGPDPADPAPEGARMGVGALLRQWRERRRVSQLELALRADSSARHISFVETGRATPSRAMVLRLAEHLDVPVRDRNALLIAAGYAPAYPETPLHDPAMATVRAGLEQLLAAYEPNPALVLDGHYDVALTNRAVLVLLTGVPADLLRPPLNAMRLTLHPRGLAPRIVNLAEWRAHLLARMQRTMIPRGSPTLRALYAEVAAYPVPDRPAGDDPGADTGLGSANAAPPADGEPPALALPMRIVVEGHLLTLISTLTTFNTPMDMTVSELAVETFLPADPETAKALAALGERR